MKRLTVRGGVMLAWLGGPGAWPADRARGAVYTRVNLVSALAGVARLPAPTLVTPWGLALSATSPCWGAAHGRGVSTLDTSQGQASPIASPLVVTSPSPTSPTGGTPTGLVFNGPGACVVSANGTSGAPPFPFATEDGTLLGWSPTVKGPQALMAVGHAAAGAVSQELALAHTSQGTFLYLTNCQAGVVEIYDKHCTPMRTCTELPVDLRSTRDSCTRCHAYADIVRLRVLPVCQCYAA